MSRVGTWTIPGLAAGICFGLCWLPVWGALRASLDDGRQTAGHFDSAYRELWSLPQVDEVVLIAKRSVIVSFVAAGLALAALGLVAGMTERSRVLTQGVLLIPLVVPDTIRAFTWAGFLAPDGVIGRLEQLFYSSSGTGDMALNAVVAVSIVPLTFATLLGGVAAAGNTCWLAAAEMRPHSWVFFRRLVLQAVAPLLLVALVVGFVIGINASAEEQYLGSSTTSMQKVASSLLNINPALLGALGVSLLLTIVPLCVGAVMFIGVAYKSRVRMGLAVPVVLSRGAREAGHTIRAVVSPTQWVALSIVVFGLWFPLAGLVRLATGAGETNRSPTFDYIVGAIGSGSLWDAFGNSLFVAVTASVVATALALQAARISLYRYGPIVLAIVVCPVLLPGDVQALSIQQSLAVFGVRRSGIVSVVISHTSWLLPFALVAMAFAYRRLPTAMIEAAREYGYSEGRIFRRVMFPLTRATAAASMAALALLSFTEFRRGWHLGGSDALLSTRVFGALQSGAVGDGPTIFAMALFAVAFALTGAGSVMWLFRRAQRLQRNEGVAT